MQSISDNESIKTRLGSFYTCWRWASLKSWIYENNMAFSVWMLGLQTCTTIPDWRKWILKLKLKKSNVPRKHSEVFQEECTFLKLASGASVFLRSCLGLRQQLIPILMPSTSIWEEKHFVYSDISITVEVGWANMKCSWKDFWEHIIKINW
jgi:hypothetical protein